MQFVQRIRNSSLLLVCAALSLGAGCATTAAETARGTWFEVKSPRFEVWTDGDPEQARALVEDLERFHQVAMAKTTAEEHESAPPLRIFLAKDESSFAALTPGSHARLAGLFATNYRGNYAIIEGQESQGSPEQMSDRHVLFHEYSHYILAMGGARVPSWYNEGFAEYMATTEFKDGGYTIGCPPVYRTAYVNRLRWLSLNSVLNAESVSSLVKDGSGYVRTRRDPTDGYLQSWYMFHYFASDGVRSKQLREYLRLWSTGMRPADAVKSALGQDVGQLDAVLHQYALKPEIDCLSIKPAVALKVPAVTVRPLSTADAHFYIGDLMLAGFGPTDAVIELLRKAQEGSGDARVLRALARAYWNRAQATEGDPSAEIAKARQYLEQAQKLEPSSPEALAIDGHLWQLAAGRLHAADAATGKDELQRARKSYRKAIKADETLAEAYYGLGLTYLIDDTGTEEPRVCLEVAAYLLPLETDIALALGTILMRRNSVIEAVPALEYVLRWSEDPEQRDKARAALAEVRKMGAAAPSADAAPAPAAPAPAAESGTP